MKLCRRKRDSDARDTSVQTCMLGTSSSRLEIEYWLLKELVNKCQKDLRRHKLRAAQAGIAPGSVLAQF